MEDLNKTFRDKMHPSNNLTGHACQVYSIQESIQSLGGLPVLFPLLEQACFKSTTKNKRLAAGTDDSSLSTKSEVINNDELTTGNVIGEDIDMVDSSGRPILSDLPVMYSPRNKTTQESNFKVGSSGNGDKNNGDADSIRWTEEIDEELSTIEVAVNTTYTTAMATNNDVLSSSTASSYNGDSLDNATTRSIPIPQPSPQLTSAIKPPLLSKEKKAGSFVVLGTPPIPRYISKVNMNYLL